MTSSPEAIQNALQKISSAIRSDDLMKSTAEHLERWLTSSAYSGYHQQICSLIEEESWETLNELFWEILPFGTGGRRGRMDELGTANINTRTMAESADGLARYYLQNAPSDREGAFTGRAVVTSDTRNRSEEFAKLTASVFAARGFKVFLFESYRSTPELSFAVRHLNCDVGVMISASHNPPSDNGFKAYWNHGGQVLAPHDQGIIDCVYNSEEIPMVNLEEAVQSGQIEIVGSDVDEAYFAALLPLSLSSSRDISILFSPLHGVGGTSVFEILKRANFPTVELYQPHQTPDGNFTNVPDQLPNPERVEVFAPLIDYAKQTGAELILASDPDADRLGVVVKSAKDEFTHLSGNSIGSLLVDYILHKRNDLTADHFVVETLVTTPLIGSIAKKHGVRVVDDLLVGFKYIGQTMDELGPDKFVFGAEESLGYLAGSYARDKDASIAALYLSEYAAELKQDGNTLLDRLDELSFQHGVHLEGQLSHVCPGPQGKQEITQIQNALRNDPLKSIAGLKLVKVRDYAQHEVRSLPDNQKTAELPKPSGSLLFFESEENAAGLSCSFAVRPSGTEPKIKFYLFLKQACQEISNLSDVKENVNRVMQVVRQSLSKWIEELLQS